MYRGSGNVDFMILQAVDFFTEILREADKRR